MSDLPGPGIQPVSLALAGRFLTTGPPGKSSNLVVVVFFFFGLSLIPALDSGGGPHV